MLNVEEESLNEGLEVKDTIFAMAAIANQKSNGSDYNQSYNRGKGKGNFNNRGGRGRKGSNCQPSQFNPFNQFQQNQSDSGGSRSERPTCQICGKLVHLAIYCYHRMDYAYQGKHPPTKLAVMATTSNVCLTQD